MPASRRALYLAPLLVACAGCMVGPTIAPPRERSESLRRARPPRRLAFGEHGGRPPSGAPVDPEQLRQWWTVFHDPMLDSLIARALQNNWDLQIAISRVREARAERAIAAGGLWPEIDATTGYNRGYGSKNVQLPLSALGAGSAAPAASRRPAPTPGPVSPNPLGRRRRGGAAPSGPARAPLPAPQQPLWRGGLPGVTTIFTNSASTRLGNRCFRGTRRTIQAADAKRRQRKANAVSA